MSPARLAVAIAPSKPVTDSPADVAMRRARRSSTSRRIGPQLDGEYDGLGFTRIKILTQLLHLGLILRNCNGQPRFRGQVNCRRQVALGRDELPVHRWRNNYLMVKSR